MKKYDVFLSYRRSDGSDAAKLLYEHLSAKGLDVFFDREEIHRGDFAQELRNAIDNSLYFVPVISPKCFDFKTNKNSGSIFRKEISYALQEKDEYHIVPARLDGVDMPATLPEDIAGLLKCHNVFISQVYYTAAISELLKAMNEISLPLGTGAQKDYVREGNAYNFSDDEKEIRRLKIQQKLTRSFDQEVYDRVCHTYDSLRVLDIGSNNGAFIYDRIISKGTVEKLVGLEFDHGFVEQANAAEYAVPGKIQFFQQNVEDEDFADKLETYMEQVGVESFNVVNISMLILHLKKPYKVLKAIRPYLEKGATVIVKDIDDGFNMAYPDDDNSFQDAFNLCYDLQTSGNRFSGREIYTILKNAGYENIRLEKLGISTPGMDADERSALFHTYFSFIKEDLKLIVQNDPNAGSAAKSLKWYESIYEKLESRFLSDSFFFNLGFVLFTATR